MPITRAALLAALLFAAPLRSQVPVPGSAPAAAATLRTTVLRQDLPIEAALVRSGRVGRTTDADGRVTLRLVPGPHLVIVTRIGFAPDTIALSLAPRQDTSIVVQLEARGTELESVVVSATRAERRVEDTPIRVEVVDEEEVAEKVAMTPGDVSMLLNETSGLRVQTTSPTLGGAGVRIQGLRGRYTLMLADGLPLYGGQSGGLGLLQIPPMDLGRVEVIKGGASALYGSNALGGVVNFISRRATDGVMRELLMNQTTRGGTDAVLFAGAPFGMASPWSTTFLASTHRQRETDIDGDRWADMPGYRRGVFRPRLFFDDGHGRSLFATVGYTSENREGGAVDRLGAPERSAFTEGLRTRRGDVGVAGRVLLAGRDVLSGRASATEQHHTHQFGPVAERDVHRTAFSELSIAAVRGPITYVSGAAFQVERYRNADVSGFDYDHAVPAVFVQTDIDAASWLVLTASARADWHNVYGTILSPRASMLMRRGETGPLAGWTARASLGGGTFAPTPFTEETEATGLTPLRPLATLVVERAVGGSLDVGGPVETGLGRLEVNGSVFASRLADAVVAREFAGTTAAGIRQLELVNAPTATRTWGAELLLRLLREPFRVTATYAFTASTEWDEARGGATRRDVPLIPRHAVGMVASLEKENAHRIGLELYYTGHQALTDNPYRSESPSYLVFGLLAERILSTPFGRARVFLNAENLLDVRQTRVDPLLLPTPGMGGRRTTDVWSLLEGRTLNAGVRLKF